MFRKVNFYLFILIITLFSCEKQAKKGQSIPVPHNYSEKEQNEITLSYLNEAIRNYPDNAFFYWKRSKILYSNQSFEKALEDINIAIGLKESEGQYLATKSMILNKLNRSKEALVTASKAEALGVETPDFYTLLGDLYQQLNNFQKSKLYLYKALQISPNNGETYFFQAKISAKQHDTLESLRLYTRAINLKPSFVDSYYEIIKIYNNWKQPQTALSFSTQALLHHPNNADLHYYKGEIYRQIGMVDSAMYCYKKAIKLDSFNLKSRFQAGSIYVTHKNYHLALPLFKQIVTQKPNYPDAKYLLAVCYEYTNRFDEAEITYDQILEQNPYDEKAKFGSWKAKKKLIFGAGFMENGYLPDSVKKVNAIKNTANRTYNHNKHTDTTMTRILNMKPKKLE
ncbi:MAG: tetratricopeptide repeat protein [Pseudarcicella sp.]|nr:tetratricopeptide repeat protein [Pseudarcicella sp.]MBP6410695.1 tetratricopeptide repeat protein [Pseudarcicella sp.]